MSEDIASIGIAVDSTQTVAGSKALDDFAKSAAGVTTNIAATSNEISNYEAKILAALQAQYGMTEAQAESIAGFKASTAAIEENNLVQIQAGENLKLNMAITKQRAAEAVAADQAMRASSLAASVEASKIANEQIAEVALAAKAKQAADAASLAFNMRMWKQRGAAAAAETTEEIALNDSLVAATVTGNAVRMASNDALTINSREVREAITIPRELLEGQWTRAAGSATVMAQAMGLVTAATLPVVLAIAAVGAAIFATTAAVVNYDEYLDKTTESTLGLGKATGLTADQFDQLDRKTSDATNHSVSSIASMTQTLIRMGDTNQEVFTGIEKSLDDYVAITGEKAPAALTELGKAFDNPIEGYKTITDKVGGFNTQTATLIQTLVDQGNKLGADKVLMDALASSTNGAAKEVGGLQGAFEKAGKAASNFFLAAGQFLKGPTSDQTAQAYSGFGYNPAVDAKKQDDSRAQAAAQANAAQEKTNQLNAQAYDIYTKTATKSIEINKLLADKKVLEQSDLSTQQKGDAEHQIDLKIASLNKQLAGPQGPKDRTDYTSFAVQLADYNSKLAQENSLYGVFDTLQQQAITKTNQEVDSIEKKKDAKGHLIDVTKDEIAQMLTATEASLYQQQTNKTATQIYEQFNKPQNDYINNLTAIEELQDKGAITQDQATEAQKRALKTYNDSTDSLISLNLASNDNLAIQQHTISTLNLETEARIRSNAEFAERIKLERDEANGIHHSPQETNKAITNAGDIAVGANNLTNANVGNQNPLGVQIANQTAADIKFQAGRVQRYAAAEAQINALVKQGTLTYAQGEQAKTDLTVANWQDRLASTDKALGEIATLTQSSNKTLAGLGKAAAIAQATIDGTLAIIKTMSGTPFPWNIPLVAAESVAVAAQIAKIASMADGGPVTGSGGPRQDNIPIMASVGEYVVNADAASKNKPLLDAINYGGAVAGNRGSHFANGGMVGAANQNSPVGGTYIDFSGANFGGADPDVIMQRVQDVITKVYAPQIVQISVQQSLKQNAKNNSRQKLNPYGAKGG